MSLKIDRKIDKIDKIDIISFEITGTAELSAPKDCNHYRWNIPNIISIQYIRIIHWLILNYTMILNYIFEL